MVMTTAKDDPPEWAVWDRDRPTEKAIRDRFLDPADPLRFLIVTAKLLTGFDAPVEGVMYLDKPLRAHTLFQAVTRTNRRWTNPDTGQEKLYGLIVDYIGLGAELAKAVAVKDTGGKKALPADVDELFAVLAEAGRDDGAVRWHRPAAAGLRAAARRAGALADARGAGGVRRGVPALRGAVRVAVARHPPAADRGRLPLAGPHLRLGPPRVDANALLWHRLGAKTRR